MVPPFFCIIIQYNMMHSDVKISGTNSGIYNILIAVSVFLVFLYVPLVQTVIDGKVVESFTVAENIDKDSGGFYLFLIFLMAAADRKSVV